MEVPKYRSVIENGGIWLLGLKNLLRLLRLGVNIPFRRIVEIGKSVAPIKPFKFGETENRQYRAKLDCSRRCRD